MRTSDLSKYGQYIALGTHIAASMIVPVLIGIYLDKHWNYAPFGVIMGALLGFAGLISIVIKLASNTGNNEYLKKHKKSGNGKI